MPLTDRFKTLDDCLDKYRLWYEENQTRCITPLACAQFLKLAIDGRLFILFHLRNEIMAFRNKYTSATDLDHALDEFTQWYASNSDTITDVIPQLHFLKKATDDSLQLLHLMRDELRLAQEKKAVSSGLWLPVGLA